jgi:hypothetical protein
MQYQRILLQIGESDSGKEKVWVKEVFEIVFNEKINFQSITDSCSN